MAVTSAPTLTNVDVREFHPRWPTRGIDPARAWVDFDAYIDDVMIYFDQPSGPVDVAIETPERDYVFLLVDEETDAIVGIHVETFRRWAIAHHPAWAPIAESSASPDAKRSAVAALIHDAAGLFALYGAGSV